MSREEHWVGIDTARRIYVNSAQIAISDHDVRLRMGVLVDATETQIVTKVEVDVFMSRSHAVAFMERLMAALGPQVVTPESTGTVQ